MGLRIAALLPFAVDPENPLFRQVLEDIIIPNTQKVKQEDTEVVYHYLQRGPTNIDFWGYEMFNVRACYEFFEAALTLNDQGFDALLIHCNADIHIDALRQAMDIPVIAVFEAALFLASIMGHRIGVITFSNTIKAFVEEQLRIYGYTDMAVPVESTESTQEEMIAGFFDAHELIDRFSETSRRAIANGADVLVPG